ncbi:uncharacterized protein LOC106659839 [Trichogramma pretiosum]|uniref:uncharacterized protein LOC106659839 n=1 Tax=Trichogramma pretiosum TaxID=7493 RepID=UPI0006C98353|nr:uncharacterized protein LOC106659839 [Trichogramma pretiosum]XP_023318834.1 uncharacterized protein LOC106659839 [Trichogramma pretiosum]
MSVDMMASETNTPTSEDAQMMSADAPPATEDKKFALLQWENERLKEFLTERNTELRKQFNMLLALQNEIMKICKDYRIKFTEANYLIKLLSERVKNSAQTVEASNEIAATPVQPMSTENMSEIHKVFHTLIENIKIPNDVELLSLMDDKYKEYLEGKYLAEMNVFLKQLAENKCDSNDVDVENVNSQKEKMLDFIRCFQEQCLKHLNPEELTQKCSNFINNVKSIVIRNKELQCKRLDKENSNQLFSQLKTVTDIQLQIIRDETVTAKVQRNLLQTLVDYDRVTDIFTVLKNQSPVDFNSVELNNKDCKVDSGVKNDEEAEDSEEASSDEEEENDESQSSDFLDSSEETPAAEKKQGPKENNAAFIELDYIKQCVKNDKLTEELAKAQQEVKNRDTVIQALREEISKMCDKEDIITAYKLEAEIRDFEIIDLQQAEKEYLQQIQTLSTTVQNQMDELERLRQAAGPNQPAQPEVL